MAFDKNIYKDGESTYEVPYWRKVVEEITNNVDTFSYKEEFEERRKIQENEVGIKHPKNDSFIKIKDDGTIEAFAGNGSGIRINADETVQVFGNIQMIGNEVQGITRTNESSFNGSQLSGDYPSLKEKGISEGVKKIKKEVEGE